MNPLGVAKRPMRDTVFLDGVDGNIGQLGMAVLPPFRTGVTPLPPFEADHTPFKYMNGACPRGLIWEMKRKGFVRGTREMKSE